MPILKEEQSPLVKLYGSDALELASEEIRKLQKNSNVPFDSEYVNLGISFTILKATEIIESKKSSQSLKSLVSESFGEAAIYKYNVGL